MILFKGKLVFTFLKIYLLSYEIFRSEYFINEKLLYKDFLLSFYRHGKVVSS